MLPPVLVRVSRVGPVHSQRDGGSSAPGQGQKHPKKLAEMQGRHVRPG